ncbi:MAG: alanine--tRNA ligase [Methanosphaera sp.]|uniref:alanine--tRNA ligase n=1 Tax=Methanosphaera sp. TaxID=2666342 RepID=UPI0025F11A71|nr:alanine--tRNA ligase [Methanosphaera sp.]MCI5867414.1 alanine--tRNA ligase [Methanosphaera sp.]MDD6534518.1 alanine--tRNA ligase [Methanosphaera sp.]MDY3955813.1 alanine--tRNA ligase [Methanosphaera sp.]
MTFELEELGYKKQVCQKCGNTFWSIRPRATCGDAPCDEYEFIGNPVTDKHYDLMGIQKKFKGFFKDNDHTPIDRYPVLAKRWRNDVFLVGASIYDFQPWVTNGMTKPPANPLVVAQPSIRLNDVDNVGRTGRHMTCFTMGAHHAFNSEGNNIYWQNQTLRYCHDFLVSIGINEEEITYIESWWKGGGNEGPSYEICAHGVELATLVFIQYATTKDGLKEIPLKVVDTGYGLERIAWVSQGTPTAYDATFEPVINSLTDLSGVELDTEILSENARIAGMMDIEDISDLKLLRKKVADKLSVDVDYLKDATAPMEAIYIVADHTRCLSFMLADGIIPSNVKEGYLARLVLRRTVKYMNELGLNESLSDIMKIQLDFLSKTYPEIKDNKDYILNITDLEEERYHTTLTKGTNLIKRSIKNLKKDNITSFPNDMLINFYDSHGIPPETVEAIAKENAFDANIPDNFYTQIAAAHEEEEVEEAEEIELNYPKTQLTFYDDLSLRTCDAKVLGVEDSNKIILDQTIFYPEGGGQPSDIGTIKVDDVDLNITYAEKKDDIVLHHVAEDDVEKLSDIIGKDVVCNIDANRRDLLTRNHTATHIVISSARKVLGKHIWQAGAQKGIEKSRIDLSHYKRISYDELKEIEKLANQRVQQNIPVNIQWYNRTDAERKYGFKLYQGGIVPGKDIRVVEIPGVDVEACAGTHCMRTGDIGAIKILRTERVQDGVERLEYAVSDSAVEKIQENDLIIKESSEIFGVDADQLPKTCERFFNEWKQQQKTIKALEKQVAEAKVSSLENEVRCVGDFKVLTQLLDVEASQLREIAIDTVEKNQVADVAVLINNDGNIVAAANDAVVDYGVKMGDVVSDIGSVLGGRGGGKPNLAQGAKMTELNRIDEAFAVVDSKLGDN